jgi:hypothetical protein
MRLCSEHIGHGSCSTSARHSALVDVLRQQINAKDKQITQLNANVERLLGMLQAGRAA